MNSFRFIPRYSSQYARPYTGKQVKPQMDKSSPSLFLGQFGGRPAYLVIPLVIRRSARLPRFPSGESEVGPFTWLFLG